MKSLINYLTLILFLISACKSNEGKIISYVKEGNFQDLISLIEHNEDINLDIFDSDGIPLSFLAVKNKNYTALRYLLSKEISSRQVMGDTINMLGYSILNDDITATNIILKYNDLSNEHCYKKQYPVHIAVKQNQISIVKLLIDKNVDLNKQDTTGNTPLFYAKTLKMFKLLHKNGADISYINNDGVSIKENAKKHKELHEYLNFKTVIDFKNNCTAKWNRYETSFENALVNISKRRKMPLGAYPHGFGDGSFHSSYNYELLYCSDTIELINCDYNSFIYALELSYYEHRPLIISPDMIWLMICQGVSTHIQLNSEKLRHHLVNFEDKKDITVYRNDTDVKNDMYWKSIIDDYSEKVKVYNRDSIYNYMVTDFTTTTHVEKTVYKIAYLDAFNSYFTYALITCGIPSITIEGAPEDWQKIYDRVDYFRKYDLEWWIDSLKPNLKHFVDASKGEIDTLFWKGILKNKNVMSCTDNKLITGWIINFIPYILEPVANWGDPLFPFNQPLEIVKNKDISRKNRRGLKYNHILSGISSVPFKWNDGNTVNDLEFTAGFVGIEQNKVTKALRPKIGYAILKK